MIFDPWSEDNNLKDKINNSVNIKILGIFTYKTPRKRYLIDFIIKQNDGDIFLMTNIDILSGLRNLYIKIIDGKGIIENISKSDLYTGSEYLILGLQLLYLLDITECSLQDDSYIICDDLDNFLHKKTELEPYKKLPYKTISLFRYGRTFYMKYEFTPKLIDYSNIGEKIYIDVSDKIYQLLDNLYKIKWEDIDDVIKKGIKIIENRKNIKNNKNWRKINRDAWLKYWIAIYKSWTKFKIKYFDNKEYPLTPFGSFVIYDKHDCEFFTDWLELYSHTYFKFNNINRYIFNNKIVEIPGLKDFREIKSLLNSCKWINNNMHSWRPIPLL